jgi:hypothetical protein
MPFSVIAKLLHTEVLELVMELELVEVLKSVVPVLVAVLVVCQEMLEVVE